MAVGIQSKTYEVTEIVYSIVLNNRTFGLVELIIAYPNSKFFLEALIKNPRTKLFEKSIFTSILQKVQTDSFKNVGGAGISVIATWTKWHFEI